MIPAAYKRGEACKSRKRATPSFLQREQMRMRGISARKLGPHNRARRKISRASLQTKPRALEIISLLSSSVSYPGGRNSEAYYPEGESCR